MIDIKKAFKLNALELEYYQDKLSEASISCEKNRDEAMSRWSKEKKSKNLDKRWRNRKK